MRVLNLSGGAFKGAYQVPIATALWHANVYDLVLGTSVGGIDGVMIAQGDAGPLRRLYEGIDTADPMFGVPGFLKPLWWRMVLPGRRPDGVFSLEPMRALLTRHVDAKRLRCRVGLGIVVRTTGAYRVEYFDSTSPTAELHDAIIASAAMSGIMESLRRGDEDLVDGGHQHVLAAIEASATDVDAVFCTELQPTAKPRCERGILNGLLWGIECALHNTALEDLEDLREHAAAGAKVRVWAPRSSLGGMLDASAKTIAARLNMGSQDIDRPTTL